MSNNESLKISYFADASQTRVLSWVNFFIAKGWQVDLYSHSKPPQGYKLSEVVNLKHLSCPVKYPFSYLAFVLLIPNFLFNRPSLIHAVNFSDYGVLGALLRRLLRIKPLAVTAIGKDVFKDAKTHNGWSIKHTARLAELITCTEEKEVKALVEMGTPPQRIKIIKNGSAEDMLALENLYIEIIEKA